MQVSVIIPLFNRSQLVGHTLASLLPHYHPAVDLEVIVVDDGSTDDGAALAARAHPRVHVVRTPNRGASAARNVGLGLASGDTVLFLDSDDLVETGFFEARLAALLEHPDAAGAYGPFDFFEGDGPFDQSLIRPRHSRYPLEAEVTSPSHLLRLLGGWYLPPQTILWRTRIVRDLGGHDETLRINQDVDLLFRALLNSPGIVGCMAARALIRDHSSGVRQGVIGDDSGKAADILRLRKRFILALQGRDVWNARAREALGQYCFDKWYELRVRMPDIADDFFELSRAVYPRLRVKGGPALRWIGAIIGARRAMLLAGAVRQMRSGSRAAGRSFGGQKGHIAPA